MDAAWSQAVIEDLIAGRRARWDAVLERSRERLGSIAPLLDRVGNRSVTIPDTRDARRVRADVETALRHLTSGGKWKRLGLVVPKPIKGCIYVKDEVLVDGQAASDVDRLQTVCDYLELELALADLGAVWSGVVATPPGTDRRVRFPVFWEQAEVLEQCCRYCSAPGFLDSGLTVFASTRPRPARRGHVAPERDFDSGISPASTARCTFA